MKQIILLYISLFAFSTFGQSAARVLINATTPADTSNRTVQVDINGNFKVVNTWDYINGVNWMMNTSKMNNDAGFITSSSAPVQSVNGQTGSVTISVPFTSLTTTGTGGVATLNSGVLNIPNYTYIPATKTFSTPTRTLSTTGSNNTFTISTTKDAQVSYTINFSVALLLALSNGAVSLDYSTNGGSNWTTVARAKQTYGASITITTDNDQVLTGTIPANALVRIYRTANTNCTVTLTANQQEVY